MADAAIADPAGQRAEVIPGNIYKNHYTKCTQARTHLKTRALAHVLQNLVFSHVNYVIQHFSLVKNTHIHTAPAYAFSHSSLSLSQHLPAKSQMQGGSL